MLELAPLSDASYDILVIAVAGDGAAVCIASEDYVTARKSCPGEATEVEVWLRAGHCRVAAVRCGHTQLTAGQISTPSSLLWHELLTLQGKERTKPLGSSCWLPCEYAVVGRAYLMIDFTEF